MKQFYQFLLLSFIVQITLLDPLQAQSPDFAWAKQAVGDSGNNFEIARAVAHDATGNTYITGEFYGSISFGDITLLSSGVTDMFIAKYDASGNILWAHRAGSATGETGEGIATDGAGNAYVTGSFTGTATFGNLMLTSDRGSNLYIAKYDPNGTILWVQSSGGQTTRGNAIAVDAAGNSYVTGQFIQSATFGNVVLTSAGQSDVFIVKLNSEGDVQWAKRAGGSTVEIGYAIAVDALGNSYVTGEFYGTASFGDIALTSAGNNDVFTARFDPAGEVVWAKSAGGSSYDTGHDIAVDGAGNAFVTGGFQGAANFGNTVLHAEGFAKDIFIVKYNADGSEAWGQRAGGEGHDAGRAIATDGSGNAYITGAFYGPASFGIVRHTNTDTESDIFIAKYNTSGEVVWAKRAGGSSSDTGSGIALDGLGNISVVGTFYSATSFGGIVLPGSGGTDVFVARFDAEGDITWARNPTGFGAADYGRSVALDGAGNIYVTGHFQGTAVFGSSTLTSKGYSDVFIAKYDAGGNVLWARSAGGSGLDNSYSIAADSDGNAYITGTFFGTTTFGNTTLTTAGQSDIFVAKYDATGNVQWARRAGGTGSSEIGHGIGVDGSGNVYVTGQFQGSASFGNITLTGSGMYFDIFIAKYDRDGTIVWAQKAGGANNERGLDIAVDAAGNSYIAGYFQGLASFGNTTLTSRGGYDAVIAKYDTDGHMQWAKGAGGEMSDIGYGIALDGDGNLFITGIYGGTANFDDITLTSEAGNNIFLAKYDNSGNVLWATKAEVNDYHNSYDVGVDGAGNAYITGFFRGTIAFDDITLSSEGGSDIFIAKYNTAGNVLWVQKSGSTGTDIGYGLAADETGNIYATGYFSGHVQFGTQRMSTPGEEMFLVKLANAGPGSPTGITESHFAGNLLLYPNPVQDVLRLHLDLQVKTDLELRLLDTNGRLLLKQNLTAVSGEFNHVLDLKDIARGVYLLQLVTDEEVVTKRILKQ